MDENSFFPVDTMDKNLLHTKVFIDKDLKQTTKMDENSFLPVDTMDKICCTLKFLLMGGLNVNRECLELEYSKDVKRSMKFNSVENVLNFKLITTRYYRETICCYIMSIYSFAFFAQTLKRIMKPTNVVQNGWNSKLENQSLRHIIAFSMRNTSFILF